MQLLYLYDTCKAAISNETFINKCVIIFVKLDIQ